MSSRLHLFASIVSVYSFCYPVDTYAETVAGRLDVTTPLGHFMSLEMTIDDSTTRFEMTGPDFSFFAFGFGNTQMVGYSLITEGTDANRTVVEQNLVGRGDPGTPQTVQNISVLSTTHDAANDLTTMVVERPNDTGDPNDPVFSPSMSQLDVIWAYNSSATPQFPNPQLVYHGGGGRGIETIFFAPIPEPGTAMLAIVGAAMSLSAIFSRRPSR
jgi:hypothetical protein